MIDFVLQYRWFFLVGLEVLFWVSAAGFFLLRYWFDLNRLSLLFLLLLIADNLGYLVLAVLDYTQTGVVSSFQWAIGGLLAYSLTWGKRDFQRLDRYVKGKVARWKGSPHRTDPASELVEESKK